MSKYIALILAFNYLSDLDSTYLNSPVVKTDAQSICLA